MTDVEERLRADLPALADWLFDHPRDHAAPAGVVRPMARPAVPGAGRRRRTVVAAMVVCLAGVGVAVVDRTLDDSSEIADIMATAPDGFGSWRAMADAPMPSRSFPVTAWTGSEMIVWAGSNLDGDIPGAFTDGAAYDPSTDSWRDIPVPGWGHPGLAGAFDGRLLFALAKNGGARFDTRTDTWTELPSIDDDMGFLAPVVADGTLWGLGVGFGDAERREVRIARYDAASDTWHPGPPLGRGHDLVDDGGRAPVPVVWTGSAIVAWSSTGPSAAFDPTAGTWSDLVPPTPRSGTVVASTAAMTDAGLTVLVSIDDDGESSTAVAVLEGDEWRWIADGLPATDPTGTTVAPAGDWLMVLRSGDVPLAVHLPTGAWAAQADGPFGVDPGAVSVWTGQDLIVWGGSPESIDDAGRPVGAIWTPQ